MEFRGRRVEAEAGSSTDPEHSSFKLNRNLWRRLLSCFAKRWSHAAEPLSNHGDSLNLLLKVAFLTQTGLAVSLTVFVQPGDLITYGEANIPTK